MLVIFYWLKTVDNFKPPVNSFLKAFLEYLFLFSKTLDFSGFCNLRKLYVTNIFPQFLSVDNVDKSVDN